jgi:arsenite transporter
MSQSEASPMFMESCRNCEFCDGLAEKPERNGGQVDDKEKSIEPTTERASFKGESSSCAGLYPISNTYLALFRSLPFLDRYLALFILGAMIMGILLGVYQVEL